MANVKTFNLSVYVMFRKFTFHGISRVAVKHYIDYYKNNDYGYQSSCVAAENSHEEYWVL
jgi:hypothetical protein